MGSKNRVGAAIQLVPGQDNDLINWFTNLPKGGRNSALKFVLRNGLDLPQPEEKTDEINSIKSELENLKRAVDHIPQAVHGGDWSQRIESELINIGQWINHFQARLETMMQPGQQLPQQQPVIEEVPELSKEEQQTRKQKLKKAAW
jgi:hypothetical protein